MSYPVAYINESESFFKNKDSGKAYLLDINKNKHFLYEVQITLDLQDIMTSRVREFKVYLTNSTSTSHYEASIMPAPVSSITPNVPANAVTDIHTSGYTSLTHSALQNQENKRFVLTSIDPKKFIDLDRFKNNFKGSASDKFGLISQISSFVEPRPVDQSIFDNTPGLERSLRVGLFAIRQKLSEKSERGLFQGIPLSKTVGLKNLKMKKASTRHKITDEEQQLKELAEGGYLTDEEYKHWKETQLGITSEYNEANTSFIQRTSIKKSSNTTRRISFLLKIKMADLISSGVSFENFGILLEGEDKKGVILDRQVVSVSLKSDIDIKKMSLQGFSVSSSEERGNFYIHANNPGTSLVKIDLYNKCLKKDVPFYSNKFYKVSTSRIPPNRHNTAFRMKKSTGRNNALSNESEHNNSKIVQLKNLNVPNIFRLTPTVNNIKFDNMYALGFNSKTLYDNRYVPIFITNEFISDKIVACINIDTTNIPKKFKKIKVYKKDLTRAIYGNFGDNLKIAFDNQFTDVGQIRLGSYARPDSGETRSDPTYDMLRNLNSFTKITDYNVESEKLYLYRIELFEDIGKVQKIYSTSYFQEKIEKPSSVCSINFDQESTTRAGNVIKLALNMSIQETDAEKVFKSILQDKFALFQDEIKEIASITTDAIAVKLERIHVDTCVIDTIAYLSNPQASESVTDQNSNSNQFSLSYTDIDISIDEDYVYKATACLRPISEIIAGIDDELSYRMGGTPGTNYDKFKFAKLRKKISVLETDVLYTLSSQIANINNIKKSVIIDSETAAGMSNQNYFSKSSTGDIAYFGLFRSLYLNSSTISGGKSIPNSGCRDFKLNKIDYYAEKTMQQIHTSNETKNKFVVDFNCRFRDDIDYCAVFMYNEGVFEHCCDMHVPSFYHDQKSNYRVLIEKQGLHGNVVFYIMPVTKFGKILPKVLLGNQRI